MDATSIAGRPARPPIGIATMDQASFASLDGLTREFRQVWSEAARIGAAPAPGGRIAAAFGLAGDRLTGDRLARGSADPLDTALAAMLRRFGPIHLPYAPDPAITVRLASGADLARTVAAIRALAHAGAELVLLDDRRDPRIALLRALAPNLVLLATPLAASVEPRGRLMALLDDSVQSPSAAALADLAAHRGAVVIGPAVMEHARRRGLLRSLGGATVVAKGRLGLRLCVGRDVLGRLGAVAPPDEDGVLEFAVRAAAEAIPIVLHAEPEPGGLA